MTKPKAHPNRTRKPDCPKILSSPIPKSSIKKWYLHVASFVLPLIVSNYPANYQWKHAKTHATRRWCPQVTSWFTDSINHRYIHHLSCQLGSHRVAPKSLDDCQVGLPPQSGTGCYLRYQKHMKSRKKQETSFDYFVVAKSIKACQTKFWLARFGGQA